jgi:hypothetical protein
MVMDTKAKFILTGALVGLALLLMISSDILASDLSCGSYIVDVGDHRYDVLQKCGEPSNVESWEEVRIRRWDIGPWMLEPRKRLEWDPLFTKELVTIEEWEYNFGPNRFVRFLRFENGRLKRVTTGNYGY